MAGVDIFPGAHRLLYLGPALPVEQALAPFAGRYTMVEWSPPGGVVLRFEPGRGSGFCLLGTSSTIIIYLTDTVTLPSTSWFVLIGP